MLRGELRKFLSSGRISQAKDFAQHNNLQLDQTSLIALDFLNRYIKGHDYLELLTDRNFEGTIPTTQGPQSSQVLMSLLCYTSVEEAVCSSAGYLLSSEQQMLLVDHLCAKGGPSRIEYLVKSLAVLQRILTS